MVYLRIFSAVKMLSSMRMEDDEDLYSGYGAHSPYDSQYQDEILQKMLLSTGHGQRQTMAMRLGTGVGLMLFQIYN